MGKHVEDFKKKQWKRFWKIILLFPFFICSLVVMLKTFANIHPFVEGIAARIYEGTLAKLPHNLGSTIWGFSPYVNMENFSSVPSVMSYILFACFLWFLFGVIVFLKDIDTLPKLKNEAEKQNLIDDLRS